MGSSYIKFKEKGFWSGDWTIELWERLVVMEIDKLNDAPDWLGNLREDWHVRAQGLGVGVNGIHLDDEISTEERRQTFVALTQATVAAIDHYNGFIPKSIAETFPMHEGEGDWAYDVDTTNVKYFAIYFLKLLNGEYPLTGSDWGGRIEHLQNEKVYERWLHLVQQKNSSS